MGVLGGRHSQVGEQMGEQIGSWRGKVGYLWMFWIIFQWTPAHHTRGTDFLCPPFSLPEGPVSAGFRFLPCGRDGSDFPAFCPQRPHLSLLSLLACGRVHELSPVLMRVSRIGLDLAAARALVMQAGELLFLSTGCASWFTSPFITC